MLISPPRLPPPAVPRAPPAALLLFPLRSPSLRAPPPLSSATPLFPHSAPPRPPSPPPPPPGGWRRKEGSGSEGGRGRGEGQSWGKRGGGQAAGGAGRGRGARKSLAARGPAGPSAGIGKRRQFRGWQRPGRARSQEVSARPRPAGRRGANRTLRRKRARARAQRQSFWGGDRPRSTANVQGPPKVQGPWGRRGLRYAPRPPLLAPLSPPYPEIAAGQSSHPCRPQRPGAQTRGGRPRARGGPGPGR